MHISDIFTSINTGHSLLKKQEPVLRSWTPPGDFSPPNFLISSFTNLFVLATPLFEQINSSIYKQFHSSTVM